MSELSEQQIVDAKDRELGEKSAKDSIFLFENKLLDDTGFITSSTSYVPVEVNGEDFEITFILNTPTIVQLVCLGYLVSSDITVTATARLMLDDVLISPELETNIGVQIHFEYAIDLQPGEHTLRLDCKVDDSSDDARVYNAILSVLNLSLT